MSILLLSKSFKILLPLIAMLTAHQVVNIATVFPNSENIILSNTVEGGKMTTETLYLSDTSNELGKCYTLEIRVLETVTNGTIYLRHYAKIQVGYGCECGDQVLLNQKYNTQSGPEHIIKDGDLHGSIKTFLASRNDVYKSIQAQELQIIQQLN